MKLLSIGTYGLHLMQFPSLRWGYVGTIPAILCKEIKGSFGEPMMTSMVFETKDAALQYFEERKHLIS